MQARAFVPNKYYLLIYKRNLISYTDASNFVKKYWCLLPCISSALLLETLQNVILVEIDIMETILLYFIEAITSMRNYFILRF